jgi:hypothetical protein
VENAHPPRSPEAAIAHALGARLRRRSAIDASTTAKKNMSVPTS